MDRINKKTKLLILLTLVIVVATILATVLVSMPQSYAVWTGGGGVDHTYKEIQTQVDSVWAKYFIYAPCTVIVGDQTISGYEIVGYKEGSFDGEMIIPREVPIGAQILGQKDPNQATGKKVIKIASSLNDTFELGYIVSKLVIYENILEIEEYTFFMMENLVSVELKNPTETPSQIILGDYSFASCEMLKKIQMDNNVTVQANTTVTEGSGAHFNGETDV